MSCYQQTIAQIAPAADARHVEAWMRLEHGCLDGLSREMFEREVHISVDCISQAGATESERLARSFGL